MEIGDMSAIDRHPSIQESSEQELKVPCEVYSRIVGYLRPVQNWHQGKKQEFRERKTFHTPEAIRAEE
jgi:anaerobic ribonucleoside-triphosphate reductase